MAKKPIVINNWQKGIGQSPYVGFGEIRNIDVTSRPGVARLNYKTQKLSSTIITNLPIGFALDDDVLYAIDEDSDLYDDDGGWAEITGGSGSQYKDIALWKDHLLITRALTYDVRGPLASSPGWDNAWESLNNSAYHPMLVAQDDNLYTGHGYHVAKLVEDTTFDAGSGATYTFTKEALDLPSNFDIIKLTELGRFLMVFANSSGRGKMFPWDIANEAPSFENPVSFGDEEISTAITVNNQVYVITGIENNIWRTDGVNVQWIGKLPEHLTGADDQATSSINPNAITHSGDRIFIGTTSSASAKEIGIVWSFNIVTGAIVEEHTISTMNIGVSVKIGCLIFDNGILKIGWIDLDGATTLVGVDGVDSTRAFGSNNYTGYVISPFYSLGNKLSKSVWRPEIRMAKPLAKNFDTISLWYRTAQNGTWVQAGSDWSPTVSSDEQTKLLPILPKIEMAQFKIILKTTDSLLNKTPELLEIILHPNG